MYKQNFYFPQFSENLCTYLSKNLTHKILVIKKNLNLSNAAQRNQRCKHFNSERLRSLNNNNQEKERKKKDIRETIKIKRYASDEVSTREIFFQTVTNAGSSGVHLSRKIPPSTFNLRFSCTAAAAPTNPLAV